MERTSIINEIRELDTRMAGFHKLFVLFLFFYQRCHPPSAIQMTSWGGEWLKVHRTLDSGKVPRVVSLTPWVVTVYD